VISLVQSDARRRWWLSRPVRFVIGAVLVVGAIDLGFALLGRAPTGTHPGSQPAAVGPQASITMPGAPIEATQSSTADIDGAIAVWTGNLSRDSADFVSATNLADLYVSRARITGNVDDYSRAAQAIEQALAAYPANLTARMLRAQVRYASHDFSGALVDARALLLDQPGLPQAVATEGDAELETGAYPAAAASYRQLASFAGGSPLLARQARLASLTGHLEGARTLAAKAIATAEADTSLTPTDRSWYQVLAGALAFQAGDLTGAQRAYGAAVEEWPGSYLGLAGLARATAAAGDLEAAIGLYERAVAIAPQPEWVGALGDLYRLTGQPANADTAYATVGAIQQIASVQRQLFNRQLVLFDANHGVQLARALDLASTELAARKDVYGWDAYAWALYASGRYGEADAAMSHALAEGTEDPLLDYHAGMIAASMHDISRASQLLGRALTRNPGFDPLQAQRARDALAALSGRTWH
jgi:tetratricopeptide (TPR) repeat protein